MPGDQRPTDREQIRAGQGRTGQGRTPVRRRRRRSNSLAAASAALYVVAVIGVSLALAAIAWVCAGDVLALNKAEHSAVVVLSPELFTQREVTETVTDSEGNRSKETRTVSEADMGKVADQLKEQGLIEYKTVFKLFAAVTGAKGKVSAGTYELNTDMDYRALISSMSAGSASRSEISVTIPEGYTVTQIFQLLEEKGVATAAELSETAADHDYKFDFLEGIPLGDPERLEGYLFPDTYRFYIGEDPLYAINKMLVNFTVMVPKETRDELADQGRSLHEIITVASLIEKETDGSDQAMIASVIYNRLNGPGDKRGTYGMLQIDAALLYALPDHKGAITSADLETDTPYNLYKYAGLPPTPIANPGMTAINAALYPTSSDYYYYALGTDRKHHYFADYNGFLSFVGSDQYGG